jgi:hypothetical protein
VKGEYRCDLLATPEKHVFIDTSRLSNRTKDVLMENRGAIPRIEEATHGQESNSWTQGVAIFLKFHVPVSFRTVDLKGFVHYSSVAIQTPRLL